MVQIEVFENVSRVVVIYVLWPNGWNKYVDEFGYKIMLFSCVLCSTSVKFQSI